VQPQFEEKAIEVRASLFAPAHRVHGNAFQLQQALLNLLLNAAEAAPPHGVIQVDTSNAPDASTDLLITIQDDGPGLSPDALRQLFTPFYTTKPDGTGLGLVITRRIVEEHAGTVAVLSEPGAGARFTVRLPVYFGS
jgi:signal transduction histidine kinase